MAISTQFVPTTPQGWRSLFWFGAGPPVLIIVYRICLPETNAFLIMKAQREAALASGEEQRESFTQGMKAWLIEAREGIKSNWFLIVYMVFLMTGFNSTSHGSQDLYPTFLKNRAFPNISKKAVTAVANSDILPLPLPQL